MGSISNKRGSVRQAPPDVYMGFMSGDSESEAMDEAVSFFGSLLVIGIGWVVLFFFCAVLWATGVLPDEMAD